MGAGAPGTFSAPLWNTERSMLQPHREIITFFGGTPSAYVLVCQPALQVATLGTSEAIIMQEQIKAVQARFARGEASADDMLNEIARITNAAIGEATAGLRAKLASGSRTSMKVSDKGALSVYGLGRFPVTLYASQWEKLLGMVDQIKAFLVENDDKLTRKE